jgi:hypothetical protein
MTIVKPPINPLVNCKDCKFAKKSQGELRCVLFQTRDNLILVKELRDPKGVCGPEAHYFKPK